MRNTRKYHRWNGGNSSLWTTQLWTNGAIPKK